MRWRNRCPNRSIDWRIRSTSAMSTPVPTIMWTIVNWEFGIGNLGQDRGACGRSEKLVAAIDHLPFDHPRLGGPLVRPRRSFGVDMEHFVPMRHQPVRNNHSVTAEIDALRAHVGRARASCNLQQL